METRGAVIATNRASDVALDAYNVLVSIPLSRTSWVKLVQQLHREAGRLPPPHEVCASMFALGGIERLGDLRVIPGLGRARIAHLRAVLTSSQLATSLEASLSRITGQKAATPGVTFPHPLGPDATFPPEIARAMRFEGATVQGTPVSLPGFSFSHPRIHHFRSAVRALVPGSALIVGGGYVGVELGMAWARQGCRVTLVESRRQLLSGFAPTAVEQIEETVRGAGIRILYETIAVDWTERDEGLAIHVRTPTGADVLEAEMLVVAVGVVEDTTGEESDPKGR